MTGGATALPRKLALAARDPRRVARSARARYRMLPYWLGDGSKAGWPWWIYLTVNSRCNLFCSMCDIGLANQAAITSAKKPVDPGQIFDVLQATSSQFFINMTRDAGELDPHRIERLVDEVAHFKPEIVISSTEPLLYRALADVVAYASAVGLTVQVTTNGFLLERAADDLVAAGLSKLWVSLDGPPAVHNAIRGPRSFERAIAGLERVVAARARAPAGRPFELGSNYTVSNHNAGSLVEYFDLITELPLTHISFSHLNYITRDMADAHNARFGHIARATETCMGGVDPGGVDVDLLADQIAGVKARATRRPGLTVQFVPELDRQGLVDFYQHPEVFVTRPVCTAPWKAAQVAANGDLVVNTRCFPVRFGNLNDHTFAELWNGAEIGGFRRALKQHGTFPACSRCCGIL